jgi:hypothetical protein
LNTHFELDEITERDGVLYITVTALHPIPGSEVPSGPNRQYTNAIFHHHWRYKDERLFDANGREYTERNEETDLVLAAVRARG